MMQFHLQGSLTFSSEIESLKQEIERTVALIQDTVFKKQTESNARIEAYSITKNQLLLTLVSEGSFRPHNALLQMKNTLSKEFGKKHHIGIREITIKKYTIEFDLEKEPLKKITIPFGEVQFNGKQATLVLTELTEEFLQHNYIDRMINRIQEKVQNQYYEGKAEYWKLIWESTEKKPVWSKDPTEEMIKKGWLKSGPTKGKWFFYPQAAALLRTMERIAIDEVLTPLGFQEVVESHIVPFDVWLKTGHMEGMPSELYYVVEPKTRDAQDWERFVDLTKITKEVRIEELEKNLSPPSAGICYAQCPLIYWSLKGKTIAEKSLPVQIYDKTAISCRYESGGRHGIERVDEFHRIEPVYIGTRQQLLDLRESLVARYKHVFTDIFNLDWRMAQVTPWYLQQSGTLGAVSEQETGTIDFEAYMPYRGSRKTSEWLEFQNLSILGDKYTKAFSIKTQKSELWSGCSGIGLERWMTVFLAQKGLDPKYWPDSFKRFLDSIPEGIVFL